MNILEASVKLFAEDSQLRASFQGLAPQAHLAGTTVGDRFAAGMLKAAQKAHADFTKEFIGPLQAEAFGTGVGRGMDPRPADQYRTADLLFHKNMAAAVRGSSQALQQLGGENVRAAGSFHGVREAARIFGSTIASEINPAFGELVTASTHGYRSMGLLGVGIGATLSITALYAQRLKEATDFQVKLNLAAKSFDPAKSGALLEGAIESLEKFQQLKREVAAGPGTVGGAPPFRAFFANLQLLFGAGLDELTKNARQAQLELAKSFAEVTTPKNMLQAEQSRLKQLGQSIGMDKQAAESTGALQASIEQLVEVRQKEAATDSALISRERLGALKELAAALEAVGDDSKAAAAAVAVFNGKAMDIDRRALDAKKQGELDVRQLRRDGMREVIAMEERQRAHAVEMGRISMAEQLQLERVAASDPRRTLQEREEAEKKVFQTRRALAEAFVTFQNQLTGKSNFKEQIEVGRGFMNELVVGSAAWLAQVSKVSDLFVQMREQAKGIFGQQVGLAEGQAGREGKTSISLDDVPDLLRRVRERDERALSGQRVPIGDLSGAVGRVDLFRTIDREGLGPREAFSRLQADPSRQVAQLSEMGNAASIATRALLGMADVLGQVGAGRGSGLSDANRGALVALKPADSSALGRGLFLESQRGPATTQTMP